MRSGAKLHTSIMLISAKIEVNTNLSAVATLNPKSVTRRFPNTVLEPKAKAARKA